MFNVNFFLASKKLVTFSKNPSIVALKTLESLLYAMYCKFWRIRLAAKEGVEKICLSVMEAGENRPMTEKGFIRRVQ
jgi:hypothetical protein